MRLEVSIPDTLYIEAQNIASANGFDNMAAYILDLIDHDLRGGQENHSHVFTPDTLRDLDIAASEAKSAKTYTRQEVDLYIAERRSEWLKNREN